MARSISGKYLRPCLWGALFFAAAAAALWGWKALSIAGLESDWQAKASVLERTVDETVRSEFRKRLGSLQSIAITLGSDSVFLQSLHAATPEAGVAALESIERVRPPSGDYTLEVVDPQGTVVLWSGPSVSDSYEEILADESADTIAFTVHNGLRLHLCIGLYIESAHSFLVVSTPLELTSPISNRFVTTTSFGTRLSKLTGTEITLQPFQALSSLDTSLWRIVPLRDMRGVSVLYAAVRKPELQAAAADQAASVDRLLFTALALSLLCAGAGAMRLTAKSRLHILLRASLQIAFLWGIRYAWSAIGFPGAVTGSDLFSPALYASTFGRGIAGSPGDLFISTLCLFGSVLIGASAVRRMQAAGRWKLFERPAAAAAGIIMLLAVSAVLIRMYGASIRSLVFDSSLRYQELSSILPDVPTSTMYASLLMITGIFALALIWIIGSQDRLLRTLTAGKAGGWMRAAILLVLWFLGVTIVLRLDNAPQTSRYYPLLLFAGGMVIAAWRRRIRLREGEAAAYGRRFLLMAACFCLAASAPVFFRHVRHNERARIEHITDEMFRREERWLQFVAREGVHTVGAQYRAQLEHSSFPQRIDATLAFSAWAGSLAGKEGYSSAVILYDRAGAEATRFVVGMATAELNPFLQHVIGSEEGEVFSTTTTRPTGRVDYYGVWNSIRTDEGEVLGYAAVIVSESRWHLFKGELIEPLQGTGLETFDVPFRDFTLSEYEAGRLVASTDERIMHGMRIPEEIAQRFAAGERRIWQRQQTGAAIFESLFAVDDLRPDEIVQIKVEQTDTRLMLFTLAQIVFVGMFLLAGFGIAYGAVRTAHGHAPEFGFRDKLLLSFGIISVLPIIALAYYNRSVADEKTREGIERDLSRSLSILERRIAFSISGGEDASAMVDNELCGRIALEAGVDFTLFRNGTVLASSRPELYEAQIFDRRLSEQAFKNCVLREQSLFIQTERVGTVDYAVGYKPLFIGNRIVGVLAVPALMQQRDVELELGERNAMLLGIYAVVLVAVAFVAVFLAYRLSRPLHELSAAARAIGRGELDVRLPRAAHDEVGEVVQSFADMTRELAANREQLARAERELAWKEMAKQVAHEIKNPLTPMKLSVQHLRQAYKDKAADFDVILHRVTGTLVEQIDVLARIATEFSHFGRMPGQRFQRIDLHALLGEVAGLFAEVQGVEFITDFCTFTPFVVADPDELRRVFQNLFRNSIQAMPGGGTVRVRTAFDGRICTVSCSDTGHGIPAELLTRVMEPNFSTKTDGMGLGLAISRRIIESLNGRIGITSETGGGTTVTIELPAAAADSD